MLIIIIDGGQNMKKIMYKQKLMIGTVLFAIFVILCQSVNATAVINKEINQIQSKHYLKEYNNEIEKLFLSLPNNYIKSLHDIVMLVWEIIAIFIGHNVVSQLLARLCCCWFVFPIVVLNNIVNINISGWGLMELIKEYWAGFPIDEFFDLWGLLGLAMLPIVYVIVFVIALISVLSEGLHFQGGVIEGIRNDLSIIYDLYYAVGNFKPDNNDK